MVGFDRGINVKKQRLGESEVHQEYEVQREDSGMSYVMVGCYRGEDLIGT